MKNIKDRVDNFYAGPGALPLPVLYVTLTSIFNFFYVTYCDVLRCFA